MFLRGVEETKAEEVFSGLRLSPTEAIETRRMHARLEHEVLEGT